MIIKLLNQLLNCNTLYCSNNQITQLPDLLNCRYLNCAINQITRLPDLLNCRYLDYDDNPLIFNFNNRQRYLFNRLRKYRLYKNYVFLWRRYTRLYYANEFEVLNLEVLYSPNNFTKPYMIHRSGQWAD